MQTNRYSLSLENSLRLVNLHPLMDLSSGSTDLAIGIIDGPVDFEHSAFKGSHIRTTRDFHYGKCRSSSSIACFHGTFILGILSGKRNLSSPALCPDCEIILRPIFEEYPDAERAFPTSTPRELAEAIIETVDAGARIVNLSIGLSTSSLIKYSELENAYSYAIDHGALLVVASGNQGTIGSNPLLANQWVIPVGACDELGKMSPDSNFGRAIGNRGLLAPGSDITSTVPGGAYSQMSGTSVAAAFVTGSIALLWSLFPDASAMKIKNSLVTVSSIRQRRSIIPQILDAEEARKSLKSSTI